MKLGLALALIAGSISMPLGAMIYLGPQQYHVTYTYQPNFAESFGQSMSQCANIIHQRQMQQRQFDHEERMMSMQQSYSMKRVK
jgi:hypothetical protein